MSKKYTFIKELGKGTFGQVVLCEDEFKNKVAIKYLKKSSMNVLEYNLALILYRNNNLNKKFEQNGVLSIISYEKPFNLMLQNIQKRSDYDPPEEPRYEIIYKYVNNDNLSKYININPVSKPNFFQILDKIQKIYKFLSTIGYIYTDLKPLNVLVDFNDENKLSTLVLGDIAGIIDNNEKIYSCTYSLPYIFNDNINTHIIHNTKIYLKKLSKKLSSYQSKKKLSKKLSSLQSMGDTKTKLFSQKINTLTKTQIYEPRISPNKRVRTKEKTLSQHRIKLSSKQSKKYRKKMRINSENILLFQNHFRNTKYQSKWEYLLFTIHINPYLEHSEKSKIINFIQNLSTNKYFLEVDDTNIEKHIDKDLKKIELWNSCIPDTILDKIKDLFIVSYEYDEKKIIELKDFFSDKDFYKKITKEYKKFFNQDIFKIQKPETVTYNFKRKSFKK